jgi:hypothetical protein
LARRTALAFTAKLSAGPGASDAAHLLAGTLSAGVRHVVLGNSALAAAPSCASLVGDFAPVYALHGSALSEGALELTLVPAALLEAFAGVRWTHRVTPDLDAALAERGETLAHYSRQLATEYPTSGPGPIRRALVEGFYSFSPYVNANWNFEANRTVEESISLLAASADFSGRAQIANVSVSGTAALAAGIFCDNCYAFFRHGIVARLEFCAYAAWSAPWPFSWIKLGIGPAGVGCNSEDQKKYDSIRGRADAGYRLELGAKYEASAGIGATLRAQLKASGTLAATRMVYDRPRLGEMTFFLASIPVKITIGASLAVRVSIAGTFDAMFVAGASMQGRAALGFEYKNMQLSPVRVWEFNQGVIPPRFSLFIGPSSLRFELVPAVDLRVMGFIGFKAETPLRLQADLRYTAPDAVLCDFPQCDIPGKGMGPLYVTWQPRLRLLLSEIRLRQVLGEVPYVGSAISKLPFIPSNLQLWPERELLNTAVTARNMLVSVCVPIDSMWTLGSGGAGSGAARHLALPAPEDLVDAEAVSRTDRSLLISGTCGQYGGSNSSGNWTGGSSCDCAPTTFINCFGCECDGDSWQLLCNAGYFSSFAGSRRICKGNRFQGLFYCSALVHSWDDGGNECSACSAGSFSSGGASATSCTPCPAGTFSSSAASTCQPCPAGSYAPQNGSTLCLQCPFGSLCPPGATAPSITTSCTTSASGSPTATNSGTPTSSGTRTKSPSQTPSLSPSRSPSTTPSKTPSKTPSPTPSSSGSPTLSPTPSSTPSTSRTASHTGSQTGTRTQTNSASCTATKTFLFTPPTTPLPSCDRSPLSGDVQFLGSSGVRLMQAGAEAPSLTPLPGSGLSRITRVSVSVLANLKLSGVHVPQDTAARDALSDSLRVAASAATGQDAANVAVTLADGAGPSGALTASLSWRVSSALVANVTLAEAAVAAGDAPTNASRADAAASRADTDDVFAIVEAAAAASASLLSAFVSGMPSGGYSPAALDCAGGSAAQQAMRVCALWRASGGPGANVTRTDLRALAGIIAEPFAGVPGFLLVVDAHVSASGGMPLDLATTNSSVISVQLSPPSASVRVMNTSQVAEVLLERLTPLDAATLPDAPLSGNVSVGEGGATGAIVGGAVGGAFLLALAFCIYLRLARSRSRALRNAKLFRSAEAAPVVAVPYHRNPLFAERNMKAAIATPEAPELLPMPGATDAELVRTEPAAPETGLGKVEPVGPALAAVLADQPARNSRNRVRGDASLRFIAFSMAEAKRQSEYA